MANSALSNAYFRIKQILGVTIFATSTGVSAAAITVNDKEIGNDRQANEYELILISDGSSWSIGNSSSLLSANSERLFITKDYKVRLGAAVPGHSTSHSIKSHGDNSNSKRGYWRCFEDNSDREKHGYSICTSSFVKNDTPMLARLIDNSLLVGGRSAKVDAQKIMDALAHIDLENWLPRVVARAEQEKWLATYRKSFTNAQTSVALSEFIETYSSNDPESLISEAITRREKLMKEEAETATLLEVQGRARETEKFRQKEATDRALQEQAKEEEKRRRAEAEQTRARKVRLDAFRKTIVIGTETNCGPVLETKANLVKVYLPVQNYGNEHWIKRDLVFPVSYECRFINGSYFPPLL